MNRNEMKQYIIDELKREDTMHYTEAGYDDWYSFFSDAEFGEEDDFIDLFEDVMRDEFTLEDMERIWQESHEDSV